MHHHHCHGCGVKMPCDGDLEFNYDGAPEVVCGLYHLPGGNIADWRCEECRAKPPEPEIEDETEDEPETEITDDLKAVSEAFSRFLKRHTHRETK